MIPTGIKLKDKQIGSFVFISVFGFIFIDFFHVGISRTHLWSISHQFQDGTQSMQKASLTAERRRA